MKAIVTVLPKQSVLDPQGVAIRTAMHHLGMEEVTGVRMGKVLEIEIEKADAETEDKLHAISRDLLSNPVIEDYRLEIVKG